MWRRLRGLRTAGTTECTHNVTDSCSLPSPVSVDSVPALKLGALVSRFLFAAPGLTLLCTCHTSCWEIYKPFRSTCSLDLNSIPPSSDLSKSQGRNYWLRHQTEKPGGELCFSITFQVRQSHGGIDSRSQDQKGPWRLRTWVNKKTSSVL